MLRLFSVAAIGTCTRYSDLRIDQRLAEVFTAIYTAWHRADSKGVFTQG